MTESKSVAFPLGYISIFGAQGEIRTHKTSGLSRIRMPISSLEHKWFYETNDKFFFATCKQWMQEWDLNLTTSGLWAQQATNCSILQYGSPNREASINYNTTYLSFDFDSKSYKIMIK